MCKIKQAKDNNTRKFIPLCAAVWQKEDRE